MCKIFASEVAERVASLAVNLFGGYGFVKDYPVEKLYRDAKIGQIYEGTALRYAGRLVTSTRNSYSSHSRFMRAYSATARLHRQL